MTFLDLHHFYKAADDLAAGVYVGGVQPLADLLGELLHMAEHQAKLRLPGCSVGGGRGFLLETLQALAGMPDARLEFPLVQQPVFIRVDQSADAAPRRGDLFADVRRIDVLVLISTEATFEFVLKGSGVLKQLTHIGPDGCVQPIHPDRLVRTDRFATVSIAVSPGTPVVGIKRLVPREPGDPVPIEGIPATTALQQSLQQIPRAAALPTGTLAVLRQLLGRGLEQLLADDYGHRDRDLIFCLAGVSRGRMARLCRPAAPGAQLGPARPHARLAEHGLAYVRGVLEHLPDGLRAPAFALGARDSLPGQTTADLTDRQTVPTDPLEDLPHHLGLLEVHLVVRLPTPFVLADIAVSIRCGGQHADRTPPGGVTLASPAPLHDLRPLVLGDHALHLEQQVLFRAGPDRAVEEDQFHAAALEFLHQQHLPGVFAGEAVRRVHVQPLEPAGPSGVAQSLQRRADQCAAGVAIVDEAKLLVERQAVGLHPLPQVGDLAVDRPLLGLLIRRNTGVDRRANRSRFRCLAVCHGSRSLGDTPGSMPASRPGLRCRRRPCYQRSAGHRNHHLVRSRQHLRF